MNGHSNMDAYHKTKNFWYTIITKPSYKKSLKKYHRNKKKYTGLHISELGIVTELYEAHIPPMLRFLHIQKLSPSGWVILKKDTFCYISISLIF